ncbi:MAG TPA: hypothetical protein VEB20_18860 [Azospirillaceae bacterium]|nr:hypothetical protein [Azospirillaceae bacterium]
MTTQTAAAAAPATEGFRSRLFAALPSVTEMVETVGMLTVAVVMTGSINFFF